MSNLLFVALFCIFNIFGVICSGNDNNNTNDDTKTQRTPGDTQQTALGSITIQIPFDVSAKRSHKNTNIPSKGDVNIQNPHNANNNDSKDDRPAHQYQEHKEINDVSRRFYSVNLGGLVSMNFGDARYSISGGIELGGFWIIPLCGDSYEVSKEDSPGIGAQVVIYSNNSSLKNVITYKLIDKDIATDQKTNKEQKQKYPIVLFKPTGICLVGANLNFGILGKFRIFIALGYCARQYKFLYNCDSTKFQYDIQSIEIELFNTSTTKYVWRHGCYLRLGFGMRVNTMVVKLWFNINFLNNIFVRNAEFLKCSDIGGGISLSFDFQPRRRLYFCVTPSVAFKIHNLSSRVNTIIK